MYAYVTIKQTSEVCTITSVSNKDVSRSV